MCKRHAICEGQTDCIYVVDGMDCSAEALAAMTGINHEAPIPFTLNPVTELAIAISEAVPTVPLVLAVEIATYLDSVGYCKAPF